MIQTKIVCDKNHNTEHSEYPYIGILQDGENYNIVLFIEPSTGICLKCFWDLEFIPPYYNDDFNEMLFLPYDGEITISNRK